MLRAIGRQLDEEADRRDAARAQAQTQTQAQTSPSAQANARDNRPGAWSTARRARLFGRFDAQAELAQYGEAFARRIHLNTTPEAVRNLARQVRTRPVLTVALRSDGTVEAITFLVGSGSAEGDEAIRQLVQGLAPFAPFPPGLARDYDVIEIRRTWQFDQALLLY